MPAIVVKIMQVIDLNSFSQEDLKYRLGLIVEHSNLSKRCKFICPTGGEVIGPYLREMRTVIHTENELRGKTDWSLVDAFRQTMFAPTMVGSPIESASKVINKHEKGQGRGYYASALVTLEKDPLGQDVSLDSTITIRMVEITKKGKFTIQAGSSIVRDSDPKKEAIEARQKAEGLLKAINSSFKDEPVLDEVINKEIMDSLLARNSRISPFWIKDQSLKDYPKVLKGKSIFMINNEDDFVHMAAHFLRHMGATVTVHDIAKLGKTLAGINNYDLIILGPGPGDPNDLNDPKVQKLRSIASTLLNSEDNQKFFGICLGHQIICAELGMKLEKLPFPQQGVQSKVRLFDRDYNLGFYNTFAGKLEGLQLGSDFSIATDQSGFVNGVRGKDFTSLQSHPESILSKDGYDLLYIEVPRLLNG